MLKARLYKLVRDESTHLSRLTHKFFMRRNVLLKLSQFISVCVLKITLCMWKLSRKNSERNSGHFIVIFQENGIFRFYREMLIIVRMNIKIKQLTIWNIFHFTTIEIDWKRETRTTKWTDSISNFNFNLQLITRGDYCKLFQRVIHLIHGLEWMLLHRTFPSRSIRLS